MLLHDFRGFAAPSRPALVPARRQSGLAVLLVACCVLLLSGCAGGETRDASVGVTILRASEREVLRGVEGKSLDGAPVDLDSYRGKVVVVNWWGSWCAPCREEAPVFAKASGEAPSDVAFLGLLARDSPAAARAFNERFGIRYPTMVDRDGRLALRFSQVLPVQAVPGTWVLDTRGRVAARIASAEVTPTLLRDVVDEVRGS